MQFVLRRQAKFRVRRLVLPVLTLFITCNAVAGSFQYTAGSWSALTGSGSGDPTAYDADADVPGISPKLTLTSPVLGDSYTLSGTYSFSIVWTPDPGDTAPSAVTVTFHKQATLSAFGTGVAQLLSGSSILLEMDSTNNLIAGATQYVSDVSLSLPLILRTDGTYYAAGSFTTDTLSTTFNSASLNITSCRESFTLSDMEPVP